MKNYQIQYKIKCTPNLVMSIDFHWLIYNCRLCSHKQWASFEESPCYELWQSKINFNLRPHTEQTSHGYGQLHQRYIYSSHETHQFFWFFLLVWQRERDKHRFINRHLHMDAFVLYPCNSLRGQRPDHFNKTLCLPHASANSARIIINECIQSMTV